MANVYVRSGAGGAGTGADWANAYTTLAAAFAAKAAGDDFWVSEDHAETQASSITLTCPGTSASPCRVICVDHTGTVPPVSADLRTTASIEATATSSTLTMTGVAYCYGINFKNGTSTDNTNILRWNNASAWYCKSCSFKLGGSGSNSSIQLANIGTRITWDNCTIEVSHTNHSIAVSGGFLTWINTPTAIQGATIPSNLFTNASYGTFYGFGVDLSAMGTGKNLFNASSAAFEATMEDCKLDANVSKTAALSLAYGQKMRFIRCGSSAANYTFERIDYFGTETTETTIVRTGGASDGTQGVSKKIVTTANSKWPFPFEALPIVIWNDATGSRTVTAEGIWGGGAVPLNDEIWIDVGYLGSASDPQGSIATSTKADALATGSNTTSSSETWGGSTTAFKMTATFTAQQKGPLVVWVKAAKASSTFYICPKVSIS